MIKSNAKSVEKRIIRKIDKIENLSVDTELGNFSNTVRSGARKRVKVKTGELRDSIIIRKKRNQYTVAATAPHAAVVEFGNKVGTQAAQPYLFQDTEKARGALVNEISKKVGDILK